MDIYEQMNIKEIEKIEDGSKFYPQIIMQVRFSRTAVVGSDRHPIGIWNVEKKKGFLQPLSDPPDISQGDNPFRQTEIIEKFWYTDAGEWTKHAKSIMDHADKDEYEWEMLFTPGYLARIIWDDDFLEGL